MFSALCLPFVAIGLCACFCCKEPSYDDPEPLIKEKDEWFQINKLLFKIISLFLHSNILRSQLGRREVISEIRQHLDHVEVFLFFENWNFFYCFWPKLFKLFSFRIKSSWNKEIALILVNLIYRLSHFLITILIIMQSIDPHQCIITHSKSAIREKVTFLWKNRLTV